MNQEQLSTDIRKKILKFVEHKDQSSLSKQLEDLNSKEIIHLIGHLNQSERIELFTLLMPESAAEMMEDMPEAHAKEILEDLEVSDAVAIINEMESGDQADLIMELEDKDAQAILQQMDPEEAESVRRLISYDANSAGGMMHTEYFAFFEDNDVQYVTEEIRKNSEKYQHYPLKYIFVKSKKNELKGVLQMQDLLLAPFNSKLSQIKVKEVVSINHNASLDYIIDFFQEYNLFGAPVINDDNILLGVILRRDILEAQNERSIQEHLESQGIVGGDELRTMPIILRAKRRLSWLSVNIILNIIAASVIAFHQDTLSSVIALAVFLPIISDMSGCSGNQAVAVSMRELSIGVVTPGEYFRVWRQEISVGLINGIVLGALIGITAFLWKGNIFLGFVVGGALALNTLIAVSIGGTVPLILKGANVDPALASGPILTTITDMVGFFLTLTFAALMLSNLGGL